MTGRIQSRAFFRKLAGFCLCLAATPHLPAQASTAAVPMSKVESLQVDQAVQTIMRRNDVPAISLAIVRHGQIAYLKAYGFAELPNDAGHMERTSSSKTASVSTLFAIGSVSKEFTAAAILMLADRGKLSLDDGVSK